MNFPFRCRLFGHEWIDCPFMFTDYWCEHCGRLEGSDDSELFTKTEAFLYGMMAGTLLLHTMLYFGL